MDSFYECRLDRSSSEYSAISATNAPYLMKIVWYVTSSNIYLLKVLSSPSLTTPRNSGLQTPAALTAFPLSPQRMLRHLISTYFYAPYNSLKVPNFWWSLKLRNRHVLDQRYSKSQGYPPHAGSANQKSFSNHIKSARRNGIPNFSTNLHTVQIGQTTPSIT